MFITISLQEKVLFIQEKILYYIISYCLNTEVYAIFNKYIYILRMFAKVL